MFRLQGNHVRSFNVVCGARGEEACFAPASGGGTGAGTWRTPISKLDPPPYLAGIPAQTPTTWLVPKSVFSSTRQSAKLNTIGYGQQPLMKYYYFFLEQDPHSWTWQYERVPCRHSLKSPTLYKCFPVAALSLSKRPTLRFCSRLYSVSLRVLRTSQRRSFVTSLAETEGWSQFPLVSSKLLLILVAPDPPARCESTMPWWRCWLWVWLAREW